MSHTIQIYFKIFRQNTADLPNNQKFEVSRNLVKVRPFERHDSQLILTALPEQKNFGETQAKIDRCLQRKTNFRGFAKGPHKPKITFFG